MVHFRHVPGRRNPPRRGLQSGDACEVRGNANGSAAIGAKAAGRKERRDGRRFAAARTTRSPLQIPGIVGAPHYEIVGFVIREELGAVGFTDRNGPGPFESRDARCILRRPGIREEAAAARGWDARDVEAVFDADGNPVQRGQQGTGGRQRAFCHLSRRAGRLFEHPNEGIHAGIVLLNLLEMGVHEFDGR